MVGSSVSVLLELSACRFAKPFVINFVLFCFVSFISFAFYLYVIEFHW